MIRKDFSRSFLRMGYDASEVLSFLVDIERTITGEETDPKKVITAQKAEDQEFSVKWRGFTDEEVDMEIDRLIQALRGLDRQREQAAQNAEQAETAAQVQPPVPRRRPGPEQQPSRHRWLHLRSPRRLPPLRRCPR